MIKKIIVGSLLLGLLSLGIFYAIDYKLLRDNEISELTNTIAVQSETINENILTIEDLQEMKLIVEEERDAEITLKNAALLEKETALAEVIRLNGVITSIEEERDAEIALKNAALLEKETALAEVIRLNGVITSHENTITQKNNEIAGLNGQIEDLNTNITTLQSKVSSAENVINFITLPEYTDPIFWEHQLDITSLNGYLNTYVSDVHYSLLINSVEVPFNGTSLNLTSQLTDGTNLIELRTYVSYNNTIYYGQTFSTSIDYIAPVYVQMSIAEALSAENGTLIEVTGVITGNYVYYNNRTADTLFIADETGEIALYSSSINNVAFSTAVIGDIITVRGNKAIYNALQEIQNAEIVTAVNEITPIERINVETYAELISKIPQRISLTATVESFKNDAQVILFFDGTTINLRLNDAGDLTTLFEIGKTYQINAHTQGLRTWEITTLQVVVQSVSDIVEVPGLEQLVVPTPLEVNLATQELIIPTIANATGYRVVLNNSITETVANTASTFDLLSYNLENNSVIELFALGDGITYADSEGVQYVLEYLQFQPLTLSIEGTVVTISDIDPIALGFGDIIISGLVSNWAWGDQLSSFINNQYDFRNMILQMSLEKDSTYNISLHIEGVGYYKSSLSSSVSFIYDFYPEQIKFDAPEIISFNNETMILEMLDTYTNIEVGKAVKIILRDSNQNTYQLFQSAAFAENIQIYSNYPIVKGFYQIGVQVYSSDPNYESSDFTFTEEYYEFEFKEVPSVQFSVSEGIITFDENELFSYWLDVRYWNTNNSVLESPIQIHSGFNLNALNLLSGNYDLIINVSPNFAIGYAQMGAGSNTITIQIN